MPATGGTPPSPRVRPGPTAGAGEGTPVATDDRRTAAAGRTVVETILRANRAMCRMAELSLHQVADDVTTPQYRALVLLAATGPERLAPLAHAMGVNPSTATRMCDRLVRKGLVTRQRSAGDRRQIVLGLTDLGGQLVDRVTARRDEMVEGLMHGVPAPERPGIVRSLGLLTRLVGELGGNDWHAGWAPTERRA